MIDIINTKIEAPIKVNAFAQKHLLAQPFVISRYSFTHSLMMVVELSCGDHIGRGEAEPHEYDEEELNKAVQYSQSLAPHFANGISIAQLNELLPSGPIRNAFDCALWDLMSKLKGKRVWELLGHCEPFYLPTVYTLGIGEPKDMGEKAGALSDWARFKIKLGGENQIKDIARVKAIREAREDAELIVDANGGWSLDILKTMSKELANYDVRLIEQPLLAGSDDELINYQSPVPLCADESCLDTNSLPYILNRYQYINIKLDKTGGLTEALKLSQAARNEGLGLMVGCMVGTSLAMAPAHIIAQDARFIDLDGPMLLAKDRHNGMIYENGFVYPPIKELWG